MIRNHLLLLSIAIVANSALAQSVVLEDHFDDGSLDPLWTIAFHENGAGWAFTETESTLLVTDVIPITDYCHNECPRRALASIQQAITAANPVTSFHVDFDFSWDSLGTTAAMQHIEVRLLDVNDDSLARAAYRDASGPGGVLGGRHYIWVGSTQFVSDMGTLPESGSAKIDIDRRPDGAITVSWDNVPLLTASAQEEPLSQVVIEFAHWAEDTEVNGGDDCEHPDGCIAEAASIFGTAAVDVVRVVTPVAVYPQGNRFPLGLYSSDTDALADVVADGWNIGHTYGAPTEEVFVSDLSDAGMVALGNLPARCIADMGQCDLGALCNDCSLTGCENTCDCFDECDPACDCPLDPTCDCPVEGPGCTCNLNGFKTLDPGDCPLAAGDCGSGARYFPVTEGVAEAVIESLADESVGWWNIPEEMRQGYCSELAVVLEYDRQTRCYDDRQRRPGYMYIPADRDSSRFRKLITELDIVAASVYTHKRRMPHAWARWRMEDTVQAILDAGATIGPNYLGSEGTGREKTPVAALELKYWPCGDGDQQRPCPYRCADNSPCDELGEVCPSDGSTCKRFDPVVTPEGAYHDFWQSIVSGARGILIFSHFYRDAGVNRCTDGSYCQNQDWCPDLNCSPSEVYRCTDIAGYRMYREQCTSNDDCDEGFECDTVSEVIQVWEQFRRAATEISKGLEGIGDDVYGGLGDVVLYGETVDTVCAEIMSGPRCTVSFVPHPNTTERTAYPTIDLLAKVVEVEPDVFHTYVIVVNSAEPPETETVDAVITGLPTTAAVADVVNRPGTTVDLVNGQTTLSLDPLDVWILRVVGQPPAVPPESACDAYYAMLNECAVGTPIPAASAWGMAAMTLIVLAAGAVVFTRRQRAQQAAA